VLAAQMLLLAPSFSWRGALKSAAAAAGPTLPHLTPLPARTRAHTHALLALVVSATFLAPLAHTPVAPRTPHTHARSRLFRAGIWTVHFGLDDTGRDSQRAMRDLVGGLELDVVGLLETDLFRPVFGARDLSRVMARELGYVRLSPIACPFFFSARVERAAVRRHRPRARQTHVGRRAALEGTRPPALRERDVPPDQRIYPLARLRIYPHAQPGACIYPSAHSVRSAPA
jgi:hypothetical protein